MITRVHPFTSIEGLVVSHRASAENELLRQRIEIDPLTGSITGVTEAAAAAREPADLVLGDDHIIFPGFIDVHVHARDDASGEHRYKETFETAGAAAIHGGVTAFMDMPNNPCPPIDDASYAAKKQLAKTCPVDVLLYAGIGPRTRPLSVQVPYKAYMGPSIGELFFQSRESLREIAACGSPSTPRPPRSWSSTAPRRRTPNGGPPSRRRRRWRRPSS
jgi:dihydroorotase